MGFNLKKGLVILLWIGGLTILSTGCLGKDANGNPIVPTPVEIKPRYQDSSNGVLCYEFYATSSAVQIWCFKDNVGR